MTITKHPRHAMLTNSKYSKAWHKLKTDKELTITILSQKDKAKIMRGLSQLKNIDIPWKSEADNYYLRMTSEEISTTAEGYLVLHITLNKSLKYRLGNF